MHTAQGMFYTECRGEVEELEFQRQVPRTSKSFSCFSKLRWTRELGMWFMGESSGSIRGKGKQLTFFIPLGPEDPAKRLAAVFLPAQHIRGHSLTARIPVWSSDQAAARFLQIVAARGGIEALQPEGNTPFRWYHHLTPHSFQVQTGICRSPRSRQLRA